MDAAWAVMKIYKLFLTLVGKWVCSSHYHLAFILKVRAWFWNPARPGGQSRAGTGPGWRKNRERKNPVWLNGLPGKTRLQTYWLLSFLFFLLKRRRFDLKKKELTQPIRWPRQNPEPGPWIRPGLKTIVKRI